MPNDLELYPGSHLLPLHIADDISSLSAILLNGIKSIDEISVLDEIHLIPFKAKAWCELADRKVSGVVGLTSHIKKHMKDIALLLSLISENVSIAIKNDVLLDMIRFTKEMEKEILDEYTTGVKNMSTQYYCSRLRKIYSI